MCVCVIVLTPGCRKRFKHYVLARARVSPTDLVPFHFTRSCILEYVLWRQNVNLNPVGICSHPVRTKHLYAWDGTQLLRSSCKWFALKPANSRQIGLKNHRVRENNCFLGLGSQINWTSLWGNRVVLSQLAKLLRAYLSRLATSGKVPRRISVNLAAFRHAQQVVRKPSIGPGLHVAVLGKERELISIMTEGVKQFMKYLDIGLGLG